MRLVRIRARGFRNLHDAPFAPAARVCVLHGRNAQGKTNLLEAAYLLSNLQSFRTHRLRDLVTFDRSGCRVEGRVETARGAVELGVEIDARGRRARVNGSTPSTTAEYLAEFRTVLFSPQDVALARGDLELRRRYLDRAAFLSDPSHLSRLRTYRRVLRQRNALLRSEQGGGTVWEERLAHAGAAVRRARSATLARVGPIIARFHEEVSGGRERPEFRWQPGDGGWDDPETALRRDLERSRERDRRTGFTGVGPHRDRLEVRLGKGTVDRHGSQGQMRSLALSFKLALLEWAETVTGERPVFLLDDPGAELDRERLGFLGAFLGRWEGQVIITATHSETVPLPGGTDVSRVPVEGGRMRGEP